MKTVHQESMSALRVLCASAVKKSRSMPTDPEDMSIRMPYVHLAHVPRHVRRRPGHLEALFRAMSVHGIHVVHPDRSEEHTSELQSQSNLVCRLLLEKKKKKNKK